MFAPLQENEVSLLMRKGKPGHNMGGDSKRLGATGSTCVTDLLVPKSHPQRGLGHRCCADVGFQVSCQNVAGRRSFPKVVVFHSHCHAPLAFPCVVCLLLGLNGTSMHELHFRASQGSLHSSCAHCKPHSRSRHAMLHVPYGWTRNTSSGR